VSAQTETVAASPSCGRPGDSFRLTGSGWAAGSTVAFTFGNLDLSRASVKSDGSFAVNETVPDVASTYNGYTITAFLPGVEFGPTAVTGFLVPCKTLAIKPTCGSTGDPITVTGTGFQPRNPVAITFIPPSGDKPITSAIPAPDTSFTASIAVPSRPPGAYAVVATQTYAALALLAAPPLVLRAEFTIPCVKASIRLVPQVGPPGTVVTVTGTGFPIGAVVKLSWSQGVPIRRASISIGSSQGFQTRVLIFPHDELGKRKLSAGPDLTVANAIIFNIASADFMVVPGSEQPRDFTWRR
jgi:hypothetical protein